MPNTPDRAPLWWRPTLAALAGLLWLGLAACGRVPTPAPRPTATVVPPTPPPTSRPTSAPTPLPTPTAGPRSFTLGLAALPGSLDPAVAADESALLITRHMYEGLVAYAPGTTRVVPALAEAWEVRADGLTWTFHLRPDVNFSDGTPFTADAAARNVARWFDNDPPRNYAFWRLMFGGFAGEADETGAPRSLLAGVEAPDARTLTLTLTRPDSSLLTTLAMPSFAIVKPAAFHGQPAFGGLGSESAGTGPYRLHSWSPESLIRLARNPNYWGPPPSPDDLVFKVIADDVQRLIALQSGEIDGMARVHPDHFDVLGQGIRLEFDPPLNVVYLGINQARPPWDHADCRAAVAHAVDKRRYVKDYFPGDADAAQTMQPPAVWGADGAPAGRPHDPDAAARLWRACLASGAEVPDQIKLYVPPLPRPYLPDPAGLGAAIQADLAQAGITVTIVSPDWRALWLPDVHSGRADLFLLGWTGLNGDPDSFLCPLFCGVEGAFNSDRHGNPLPPDPELTALLEAARTATDPAEREALYVQAHAHIFETVPAVPLAHRKSAWAYRAGLRGTVLSPVENVFFGLADEP